MTKQQQSKTTDLSDEKAAGESPETKVKDPDLAEFCDVYGKEKGMDLWQSGASIADIRTLKELIEKYGVPGPPEAEKAPATELNADPAPADSPKPADKKDEDKETTELKAAVTALKAELTSLRAAMPRGEQQPVKHNFQNEEPKQELSPKDEYLQSFNKRFQK